MSHLDPRRPATTTELRDFGLLVGVAFLVIAAVTFWRDRPLAVFAAFGALGGALVLAGIAAPAILRRVYAGWMGLAVVLSKVTTPIFMGVIYFVVLTPIGLLMRVFGRNPLRARAATSVWVTRAPEARRSVLERQF
jgi:hypothetical protein